MAGTSQDEQGDGAVDIRSVHEEVLGRSTSSAQSYSVGSPLKLPSFPTGLYIRCTKNSSLCSVLMLRDDAGVSARRTT
jgi:hypothetical protein